MVTCQSILVYIAMPDFMHRYLVETSKICDWLCENLPCSHENFDLFLQFENNVTFTEFSVTL